MTTSPQTSRPRSILLIGISRGIGRGLAAEYVRRGWSVVGTVRDTTVDPSLPALVDGTTGTLRVEHLDMTVSDDIAALSGRLAGERFNVLLVNAGISDDNVPVADMSEAAFNRVMSTNALAPLKVVEALQHLVVDDGVLAVMSSRQGSIALNDQGGFDVYRASKSALNQLFRSYAARHPDTARALLVLTPGWVQTELGGPYAPLTVEQSAIGVADTVDANRGTAGIRFVDQQDQTVPW